MQTMTSILLRLFVFGTLLGCRNNEDVRPDSFVKGRGEVSALQNGMQWTNTGTTGVFTRQVRAVTCAERRIGLVFYQFNRGGYQRQLLSFGNVPRFVNQYSLTDKIASDCTPINIYASFATVQDDGDVSKSTYSLDSTAENYLRVTVYDSINRRISGVFKASFIKQARYVNDDPYRMTFENGQFSTIVAEKGRFE